MKTPIWEAAPGALVPYLNGNTQAIPHDLFRITLSSGTELCWTSLDVDAPVAIGGRSYSSGPLIQRSSIKRTIGLAVDEMALTIYADDSIEVDGQPLVPAIAAGLFDNAAVRLDRLYCDSDHVPVGAIGKFAGSVGDVEVEPGCARIKVRSDVELLDVMVPGEVYQPGCRNALFDGNCGVDRLDFLEVGVVNVASGLDRRTFSVPVSGRGSGFFTLGIALSVDGPNEGISRTVRGHVAASGKDQIELIAPFPNQIELGDTFHLFAGCDRRLTTCVNRFDNRIRFRAEPYIPAADTIT